jgi:hypothetical protein
MPGRATKVRTVKLSGGRTRHLFAVSDAGSDSGHTGAGPARKSKGDDAPKYRVKPDAKPVNLRRKKRGDTDKKA